MLIKDLVSVIMTNYNTPEKYLREALDSILNQTYTNFEFIIVDDGSTDNSLSVIESYADSRIIVLKNDENIGLTKSLNKALEISKGEYVARMDSDDISLPDRCKLQLTAFAENPLLDIVGFSIKEFSGSVDNIVGERRVPESNAEIYKFAKLRDPFNHPTVMFRKSKVLSSGNYGNYRKNQDSDLWIKMLKHEAVCMNLPEDQFRFRFDEATYARRKNWMNTSSLIEIRYKAWKNGYNNLLEFLIISIGQLGRYVLPISFQKILYHVLK